MSTLEGNHAKLKVINMASIVKVKYEPTAATLFVSSIVERVHRDLVPGETYSAWRPEHGERDPHGFFVTENDELWIDADSAGDVVVTRLGYGFLVVQ